MAEQFYDVEKSDSGFKRARSISGKRPKTFAEVYLPVDRSTIHKSRTILGIVTAKTGYSTTTGLAVGLKGFILTDSECM